MLHTSQISYFVAVTLAVVCVKTWAQDPAAEAKYRAEHELQLARLDETLRPRTVSYRVRDRAVHLEPQTQNSDAIVVYVDAPKTYETLNVDAIRDLKNFPKRPKRHEIDTQLPNGKTRHIVLIARAQLLPEKDLRALADSLALPPMAPTYANGAVGIVPQGTFTGRAIDDSQFEPAKALLKQKGYTIKPETFLARTILAEKPSTFAALIESMEEVSRSGKFIWCEPGLVMTGRLLHR